MTDYLIHYGVKGMKWGVRHDYVRKGRKKDNTEQKINKQKALKYAAIGAGIVAAGIIVYGGYKIHQIHKTEGYVYSDKKVESIYQKVLASKKLPPPNDFDDLSVVNPTKLSHGIRDRLFLSGVEKLNKEEKKLLVKEIKEGNYSNCAKCTIARDLRSRGYDVVAGPSTHGMTDKRFIWCYEEEPKPSTITPANAETAIHAMLAFGNGASGDITLSNQESGHSMYFKVINGRVRIFDYQTGLSFDAEKEFAKPSGYFSCWDFGTTQVTRLDNLKPDIKRMIENGVIKPRG